ncbi:hypothetical protein SGFS_019100 [Streptomyces graminofaciens]|uniref:Transposase n=1 Tax=Streptomyces graminofaciens TaxID=68212 RepID=A0ABM7F457_9ACTN|nr:hypothetical protein SGFS_019100 [Streptomyces graminofaciens]
MLLPGSMCGWEGVNDSSGTLVVEAVSMARPGRCPNCCEQALRAHRPFQRTLNERRFGSRWGHHPAAGEPVLLRPQELLPHDLVERVRGCPRATAVPAPGWRADCGRSRRARRPSRRTVIEEGAAQPEQRTVPLAVPPPAHWPIHKGIPLGELS